MDKLIIALGPAFAAGFAVQRLLEILDPIFEKIKPLADNKKIAVSIISVLVALALAFGIGLRVLQPLGVTNSDFLDGIVTALIISAGTEGFNSIMKFLGYSKEEKKAEAATAKDEAKPQAVADLQRAA